MKTVIVFALFVALVAAAPRKHSKHQESRKISIEQEAEPAQILRFENDNIGVGPYNFV